jgi:two-component system, NtrC family, sensor histidine kinase KinB
MSIKRKVALGLLFLFVVIIGIASVGVYYLKALSGDSQNILRNNYESLEYSKRIIQNCDSLLLDSANAINAIEQSLQQQEANITEKGERELTHALRVAVEKIKNTGISDSVVVSIRQASLAIQELNMRAIVRKNEISMDTSRQASNYLIVIGTMCTLIALTFILNFPGYIANPVIQLTQSIKSIANKQYEERLHFERNDEFQELAEAFNLMAEKLDEYEHSNLAKILFEKKRIETIIDRMNDPVIGLDEKDKVVFVNDQALSLLNLKRENVLELYAPDIAVNNDLFRSLIRKPEKNGEPSMVKVVVNGKENYFSRETTVIQYHPTGEVGVQTIGQVIILKNITSFKELDLAKTNFIATISHELKTPIASLQMGVKLLQDSRVGELNTEQKNIVATLFDEMGRISRITNELLDLSQVETGNIKLNIRRADPKALIPTAMEAVKFQAERKHVLLQSKIEAGIPEVLADFDKTAWVLVNFLTNAIRYSPENGTITIRANTADCQVKFSVEDEGPGIEKRYISRLFEKFYQVPGTPSGTGLGLAISKEFIEAQQGHVSVSSEIGKGSNFSFTLPVAP